MTPEIFYTLLGFATFVAITPGPNGAIAAATSARFGLRSTVPHLVGSTFGYAIVIMVAIAVLSLTLQGHANWIVWMRLVGLGLLIFLAVRLAAGGAVFSCAADLRPLRWSEALMAQALNPKPWIAALVVASQFLAVPLSWFGLMAIGAIFAVAVFSGTVLWALAGQTMQGLLTTALRQRIFNAALAACVLGSAATMYLP